MISILYFFFSMEIIRMFTSDPHVSSLLISIFPVLIFLSIGNYTQCICQGIIRAMGYQKYASYACLLSYWLISFPITYILTFYVNYGIKGIFMGLPF
mmetsp:Transcript_11372/g.10035  ORF Transcript_11372/g.10035 Transcript_11372/m.10035 type:complete len:97 (+) Transcript_11372:18-308(+)